MPKSDFKILAIDDEKDILLLLKYNLESEGYIVKTASSGKEGLDIASKYNPDLILIDIMMPEIDGIETCRKLREIEKFQSTFILFLTARVEEYSEVAAFDAGGDDYITKPFSPAELIARIKALLKRSKEAPNDTVLTYGNIKMDTGTHRVYCCDQEAKLGPREYRILEFLMRNPGRVYSRQQILDSVWGTNVYVTDRTIDVHIRRLRKALSSTEECKVIRTIRSSGYSLDSQS